MPEPVPHLGYRVDDRVVRLSLNRPPLNILDLRLLGELEQGLIRAAEEGRACAVVVEAEGKAFCAGVDVADHTPEVVGEMIPLFDRVCRRLAEMPLVTVARVQGSALGGGCELVACCDFSWMVEDARIGQPEIQLGVFPPVAALLLPRLVGPRWAARLTVGGEIVDGATAARIGLVGAAVPAADLDPALEAFLDRLRTLSAAALRETVRAHRLAVGTWGERLAEIESIYLDRLMKTRDAAEGLAAFLEKRPPAWTHS